MSSAMLAAERFEPYAFVYENSDGRWWVCVIGVGGYQSIGPFVTWAEAKRVASHNDEANHYGGFANSLSG